MQTYEQKRDTMVSITSWIEDPRPCPSSLPNSWIVMGMNFSLQMEWIRGGGDRGRHSGLWVDFFVANGVGLTRIVGGW